MPTVLDTPGVYFTEIDNSQYTSNASTCIAALVGSATKGPINVKTYIVSYSQLTTVFGIPDEEHPALIAAREFFKAGGTQLWFIRVTDGADEIASATIQCIDSTTFPLEGLTSGSFFNDVAAVASYGTPLTSAAFAHSITLAVSASQNLTWTLPNVPVQAGTVVIKFAGTVAAKDDSQGNLVFGSGYSAYTGTINYKTGVINITAANIASGSTIATSTAYNYYSTFNLQSRLSIYDGIGNLLGVRNQETFTGLTLANVVATLASSNYLYLSSAPDSFPVAGVYPLSGGTDGIENLEDVHYIGNTVGPTPTGLQCVANANSVIVDVAMVPGISSSAVRQALINLAQTQRRDCVTYLDPPSTTQIPQDAVDWRNGVNAYSAYGTIESTYCAVYWPWFTQTNDVTNAVELVPPSVWALVATVRGNYWQAPAGPNRGYAPVGFVEAMYDMQDGDCELFKQNQVNPIAPNTNLGTMIMGQMTTTTTLSALNRLAARRTLLVIERNIVQNCKLEEFEPDNPTTWKQLELVNQSYLTSLTLPAGTNPAGVILAGTFTCDSTTNTVEIVSNDQTYCKCAVTLTPTTEDIIIGVETDGITTTILENIGNQAA